MRLRFIEATLDPSELVENLDFSVAFARHRISAVLSNQAQTRIGDVKLLGQKSRRRWWRRAILF
jgi:hypothetical protein